MALVATGTMVKLAAQAADALAAQGVRAMLIDMHTLKPLDEQLLERAARATGAFVTIEEHSVLGGLGGAVCEALSQRRPAPVLRVGIPDRFGESGAYAEILSRAGLDVAQIVAAARRAITMK